MAGFAPLLAVGSISGFALLFAVSSISGCRLEAVGLRPLGVKIPRARRELFYSYL